MKNSGTRKAMQTPTWRSICAMLCLLLLLSALFPVKAAAETVPAKVVRVGSFEDTFNYVNEKGIRKGYGYELLQTLSGYTGWQLEYVTCDWSDCFEKLKNGEIDIMGDISYTEDRTEEMLFSDEPMGEEKDYLYADLSREDITASDFKTLNGKKIGVLMGTEPEVMLTEWEEKYDLKTQHVNIANNEDAKQKLANHEIDCFVSMEESFWTELGISTITRVGSSDIYYAINKDRADIKEELDNAMRALEDADPFYTADLYKRYFSMDYTPILTGEEKAWLKKHGAIRMGFLTGDSGVSVYDPSTGELTGTITDYIRFAKDCLGNQELEFQMVGYDSQKAELDALKSGEIDMVFHFDQSPNLAEEYRVACTNTTWTSNMMAVTNKEHFNETQANRVAVPQNKISLTRYLAVYYPQWEIVDCAAQEDAARLVKDGQADCFVTGVSSQENYSKKYDFYSVPLPNPAKSCFAVNSGNGILLSILNKTIKAMPVNMLTGALAKYRNSRYNSDVEVTNTFDDADVNYWANDDEKITYLSRSAWDTTYPTTLETLTVNDKLYNGLNMQTYVKAADAKSVSDFNLGVELDEKINFSDMIGVAFDDPKWNDFLSQLTLSDLLINMGDSKGIKAVKAVNKPGCTIVDGPEGMNGQFKYGDRRNCTGWATLPIVGATWNHDVQTRFGEMYGEDALYASIPIAYAPGADTLRSPYSGRTSEYFSEDGVLSYYAAKAVSHGMRNKGLIGTVKHFFLNEQEAGRQGISTFANEQAIREIYMRAFEGSLAEGDSLGVMTAYNRIGVMYAAASQGIQHILRDEWNYGGYIIDDALTASEYSSAPEMLMAGNNIFCLDTARPNEIEKLITSTDDGDLLQKVIDSNHYLYYIMLQSSMGGSGAEDVVVSDAAPWWQTTLRALDVVFCALAVAAVVMYVLHTYTDVFSEEKRKNRAAKKN